MSFVIIVLLSFDKMAKLYFRVCWVVYKFACQSSWSPDFESNLSTKNLNSCWSILSKTQMICGAHKSTLFSDLKAWSKIFVKYNNVCQAIFPLKTTNFILIFFLIKLILKIRGFLFFSPSERKTFSLFRNFFLLHFVFFIFWLQIKIKFLQGN